jgi:hypothetical protein
MSEVEFVDNMYNSGFQKQAIKLLAQNVKFAVQYGILLKEEYFENPALRSLAVMVKDFVFTYEKEMDLSSLMLKLDEHVQNRGLSSDASKDLRMEAKNIFNSHVPSERFITDKLVAFARRQELKSALYQSVEILEKGENYEQVLKLVDKAVSVGSGADEGITFADFYQLRDMYNQKYDPAKLIHTGFRAYDRCLDGGMAPGELHVVQAKPKTGKSFFACNIGANCIKEGKAVFHITMELSREDIAMRYAQYLTRMDKKLIMNLDDETYQRKIQKFEKYKPNLFINYWTQKTANAMDFRSWISRIRAKTGIKPDIIIVDYDDLVLPVTRTKDNSMYEDAGGVYGDLISLGDYFQCPVFTLAQPQREAWDLITEGKLIEAHYLAHSAMKAHKCFSISSLNFGAGSDNGILYVDMVRRGSSNVKIKLKKELNRAAFVENEPGGGSV